MSEVMKWNGNELVFASSLNNGVAGIAPDQPVSLGEEISRRWNAHEELVNALEGSLARLGYVLESCFTEQEQRENIEAEIQIGQDALTKARGQSW